MTSDWRLINGEELYDIKNDMGQKSNVASGNPEVVERLREFYEEWWKELEPTFEQSTAIYLGHPADNPARLTSHDWITTQMTPWNQQQVRSAMNGPQNTGFWNVKITEAGTYEIRLRRWPEEADEAIGAALPAGEDVPGVRPYRAHPGVAIIPVKVKLQIGDLVKTKTVNSDHKEVTFQLELKPETTTMSAVFLTENGEEYGAYYAYVEKKN